MLIGAAQCDSEKNDTLNVVIQLRTTINFETKILGGRKKKEGVMRVLKLTVVSIVKDSMLKHLFSYKFQVHKR